MVALRWTAALVRRRPGRIAGAGAGIALAVALLGSVGAFVATAKGEMTARALRQVAVDWQVEVQPGTAADAVGAALARRSAVRRALRVEYGATSGLEAATGGTTQTTGPGVVLGLPARYRSMFPGEIRNLAGRTHGVLLTQQTAANLHAAPGDTITIGRAGLASVAAQIDGIVDLPAADSLFQRVGAAQGAQAQAPPDNVVLLPAAQWHTVFDALRDRADVVHTQFHVRLDHHLPPDPSAAFTRASGEARRFEADVAGSALVGDNLAATLDAARSDALYAQVLFVLLGLPGALLAGLLTRAVAEASRGVRRRELALLRTRGASSAQLQRVALAEAAIVGTAGAAAGLVLAGVIGRAVFKSSTFGATSTSAWVWAALAAIAGLLITAVAVGVPAWRDAAMTSVMTARRAVGRAGIAPVLRYGVDIMLLAGAALVFWATGRAHYNLVLAPEGVPTVSVSYWALAGPLLLWSGSGLFVLRVVELCLGSSGAALRAALRPVAGSLRGPAASTLRRQRRALGTGVVLVALAATFAISTSVFNSTYRQQVQVDALLTNGAAVTVTESPGNGASAADGARLARVAGVGHVEAMQHRFVYVGADLQDLYGVNPTTIGAAAQLQNAYFAGGSARQLLARMARQPDAALVSAETVHDFQLQIGDRLHLRVRDRRSGGLDDVTFHYAGVVKEFPTAPSDSFVVANASYIAQQTGDGSVSSFLISTAGASPRALAQRLRPVVGTTATVANIEDARRVVGSSLTAVDLAALTKVELVFALLLVAASTGLVCGLGLAERRRSFAIASALGAKPRQLAAFARSEAAVFAVLGSVLGVAGGWVLAHMLVKVLTGVFDPAPASLAVPWRYLIAVAVCGAGALVAAVVTQLRSLRGPLVEIVRDL